jgi:hypothetical protein
VSRKPDVLYGMGFVVHPLTGRFVPRLEWVPDPSEGQEEVEDEAPEPRGEPFVVVVPVARRIVRRAREIDS